MLEFYKRVVAYLLGLLLISLVSGYFCMSRAFLHLPLLPNDKSPLHWTPEPNTADEFQAGQSFIQLNDANFSLDFDLKLSTEAEFPGASVGMEFRDATGELQTQNLSRFDTVSFRVKCSRADVLSLMIFTPDEEVTKPGEYLSYRAPTAFFSCNDSWRQVSLDLTRMELPQWWLDMFHLQLSMSDYSLAKVAKIQFGTSHQSPRDQQMRVQITDLVLGGWDSRYIYAYVVGLLMLWGGFAIWFFRQHSLALIGDLKSKFLRDRPLVAYQQLSIEPLMDRDKDALLRYMAVEYVNPELNMDTVVSAIGVSRTKINDILKAELGYTFIGYLNKLRLTEAARLLVAVDEANIANIAYSVGYKSPSYFNKLFKEEYGCTPKAFKRLYEKTENS